MKLIYFILLIVALCSSPGCSTREPAPVPGPKGDPGESIVGPPGSPGSPGLPGVPGQDGAGAEVVDPCGDHPDKIDDVLLSIGGTLVLGTVKVGGKTYLASLSPGVYQTQDGTGCAFAVTDDGEVLW